MAHKAMWDWMDKQEGRKDSSYSNMNKERERQGYKKEKSAAKKKELAKKIDSSKKKRRNHSEELGHLFGNRRKI